MPCGLHRTYGAHHLHFITCSCYRRLPFLRTARTRDRFLSILEETRRLAQAFDLAGHSQHNGCAVLRVLCEGRETEMPDRTVDHATLRQGRGKVWGVAKGKGPGSIQPTPLANAPE